MADEPRYTPEQFNETLWAVMRALMGEDGVIDDELSLDTLAFAAAIIFDMHPDLHPAARVPRQTKNAAEMHASVLRGYLDWMQRHYRDKGERFGEMIGGEEHLTADLPLGHIRQ
jgi:hypothetical protein